MALVLQMDSQTVFFKAATIGTLILLIVYVFATVGAMKQLFFSGEHQVAQWEIVIPILALGFLGYTLWVNFDVLTEAGDYWPLVTTAAWVVAAAVLVVVRPDLARQAGDRLRLGVGLAASPAPDEESV